MATTFDFNIKVQLCRPFSVHCHVLFIALYYSLFLLRDKVYIRGRYISEINWRPDDYTKQTLEDQWGSQAIKQLHV